MVKTEKEIEIMKQGGRILARVLRDVAKMAKPGKSTKDLNRAAEALILEYNAVPSFKGYMGFPSALCTSVNEEIVHVMPSERILKQGDIICLDLGILFKGYHTDMAVTVGVGKISRQAKYLIDSTRKALEIAIKSVRPEMTTRELGKIIEDFLIKKKLGVVRELCGHGIGKEIHQDPQIPNYADQEARLVLKENMVICIEPMATLGDWRIKKASDKYGLQTKDLSLAAHFEHTIVIRKKAEVLTSL